MLIFGEKSKKLREKTRDEIYVKIREILFFLDFLEFFMLTILWVKRVRNCERDEIYTKVYLLHILWNI